TTMQFEHPHRLAGNAHFYGQQLASGWSSTDHDGDHDPFHDCATLYGGVAQHYRNCWRYNLGAGLTADGGWGPHAFTSDLQPIGLQPQSGAQTVSRVNRISRFVRWTPP